MKANSSSSEVQELLFNEMQSSVEEEREKLLEKVSAAKLDTLQERVAWILNHYPEARDSDITLQIKYWDTFEPDLGGGEYIKRADLYNLTRLTSLARARAKIQNTYRLFQASPEIQKQRMKLSSEELAKAIEQKPVFPSLTIYADESGKTGNFLIVGSVWVLHPPQLLDFFNRVKEWKDRHSFNGEFHFKSITENKLPLYKGFANFLVNNSATISFKAISVENSGFGNIDDAFLRLFCLLISRGVEHEDSTRRAALPRGIQIWKDLEEAGKDKLFLARLKDELKAISQNKFDNKLAIDELWSVDSKGNILIQVADLFTSSINRVLNAQGNRGGAKDQFADYFLELLNLPDGPIDEEASGDMTFHISL